MSGSLNVSSIVRSSFPDFQVEIKISLTDESHLSDIQLVIDGLLALIEPIQHSTVVIEDTISVILVGRDLTRTYIRNYKVGHYPERQAQYVSGKGWR